MNCKNPDFCKAVVQMDVLNRVCGYNMDIDQAIKELGLDDMKYYRLAYREDFNWVARKIRSVIKGKK